MQIAQQVGLGAAIDYLEALGMDAVREHEREMTSYALEQLLGSRLDERHPSVAQGFQQRRIVIDAEHPHPAVRKGQRQWQSDPAEADH